MTKAPLKKQKSSRSTPYTPFYLIMLILSTVSVAFSSWGMLDAYNLVVHAAEAPVYTGLTLVSICIVLPLAMAGLVLLYQRRKLGLRLMLASLALNFFLSIALLFYPDQAFYYFTLDPELGKMINETNLESIFTALWPFFIGFGNLCIIAAAVLWHFAWQNQHKSTDK